MSTVHPCLLIVTGPPAAGKSTLAARLATDLRLPLLTKDGFKETLFDALGIGDVAWSQRLGRAGYDLLFHAASTLLAARIDCIIEANFDREASLPSFERLQAATPYRPIQIVCRAEPHTLVARYAARHISGARHPGHHGTHLPDPASLLQRHGPMPLQGSVIVVYNETEKTQRYDLLMQRLRDLLSECETGTG